MGSSAKKKREKKKDFQKAKLKVGKARPKAANQTNTNFRSKAIVLNQQSLSVTAPSASSQFSHHVSLLSSRSDTQRRDSLAYLTTSVASRPVDTPLQLPTSTLLPKLCPLILDGNSGVRNQVLKMLQVLPESEVADHASEILPYVRAGMTHLAANIRLSTISVLSWLNTVAGEEIVSSAGGWFKTLNCFMTALGWHGQESSKWSLNKPTFAKAGVEGRPMIRNMQVLAEFIQSGIGVNEHHDGEDKSNAYSSIFPLWHTEQHAIPVKSNVYAYLNLFGMPKDDENAMLETREDRLRIFEDHFRGLIELNLEHAKSEGGELGRAAAHVTKALKSTKTTEPLKVS